PGAGQPLAIGTEAQACELGPWTFKGQGFLARSQLPQPGRPVLCHACQAPAIRAERHRGSALAFEAEEFLTRRQLPYLQCSVRRDAGQARAVRAEGYALDGIGVPFEREDLIRLR